MAIEYQLIDSEQELVGLSEKLANAGSFALDSESVNLDRNHLLSLSIMESRGIRKVMFDCRSDVDCLKWINDMNLRGVEDLQLVQYVIENPDLEPANKLRAFEVIYSAS